MKKIWVCVCLALLIAPALMAQEIDTSAIESKIDWDPLEINIYAFDDISQTKLDLILTFIEESGTIKNLQKSFRDMYATVGEEDKKRILEFIDIHRIVEQIVPIYDQHYTEIDLQQIVAFYKSPSGAKMLEAGPQIMQEAISVTAKYFQSKLQL